MPTYQYVCRECGGQLEAVQKFTDEPLTVHEDCGGRLRKVFSPVGIVFKGSGFYRNDSRGTAPSGAAAASAKAGAESSSSAADASSKGPGDSSSSSKAPGDSSSSKSPGDSSSSKSSGDSSSSSSGGSSSSLAKSSGEKVA